MLVVLAGLPGTGKTTLARRLAAELRAAYVRVDAIEAAVVRSTPLIHPLGPVGYVVAEEVAAGCLAAGTPVVVDAVNPVAAARAAWHRTAAAASAVLLLVEVVLDDAAEHRRRVEQRTSDVAGLVVPTWDHVRATEYQPWDEQRDGPRLRVDGADADRALATVLAAVRPG